MHGDAAEISDEALRAICRIAPNGEPADEKLAIELRAVPALASAARSRQRSDLQHAMALLASVLGRLPQHHITHLPFGYEGPALRPASWIDRDTLHVAGKQIVGMIWIGEQPDVIAAAVEMAIADAVQHGLIDHRKYDAWRPGMASGTGWRIAVSATLYGTEAARRAAGIAVATKPSPAAPTPIHPSATTFFLYAASGAPSLLSPDNVFFQVDSKEVALSICRLCKREFATAENDLGFFVKSASSVGLDDLLLLDDQLERLSQLGVANRDHPPPPFDGDSLHCVAYFLKARAWAPRLLARIHQRNTESSVGESETDVPKSSDLRRDPLKIWLAAETMKCITLRLSFHSLMVRADKPSRYDDRDELNRDAKLAERNGYVVVSAARQLGLDEMPLIRILREDRLWEYPNEKEDTAVIRAASDIAERVSIEARIWCAEAGIDPEEYLETNAAKGNTPTGDTTSSEAQPIAAGVEGDAGSGNEGLDETVAATTAPQAEDKQEGLKPFRLKVWSQVKEVLRIDPGLTDTSALAYAFGGGTPQSKKDGMAPRGDVKAADDEVASATTVDVDPNGLRVDADTFTVWTGTGSHTFRQRTKLLFKLLARLARRIGTRVPFDQLREKDDVWDGSRVEDVSIRTAVTRLKAELAEAGLRSLADAIRTGRYDNQAYAILDFASDQRAAE